MKVLPEPVFLSAFQFSHQSVLCICYDYVVPIFVIIEKNKLFLQFYKYDYLYFTIYTQIYLFFKGKNLKSWQFAMKSCQFAHTHVDKLATFHSELTTFHKKWRIRYEKSHQNIT